VVAVLKLDRGAGVVLEVEPDRGQWSGKGVGAKLDGLADMVVEVKPWSRSVAPMR
jgi:hypothetical protein